MENKKPLFDKNIIDSLAKDGSKLEVQPRVEFAQNLEQKILSYEVMEIQPRSIAHKLYSFSESMTFRKKIAVVGLFIVVFIASFNLLRPQIFTQVAHALSERFREVININFGENALPSFSTSTEDTLHPSSYPHNVSSSPQFDLEQAEKEGKVTVLFKENIEGFPVIAFQLANGECYASIGTTGKIKGPLIITQSGAFKNREDIATFLRNEAKMAIADAKDQQKIDEHLENTYQVSKFSTTSLDEFFKVINPTIMGEVYFGHPYDDPDEKYLLVRFPDGSTATVHQLVTRLYTGQKQLHLLIEAVNLNRVNFPLRPVK